MKELIKVIAFDADDTLWSNEPFFQEVEKQYTDLLKPYGTSKEISAALFQTEMNNLQILGYGAKAFTFNGRNSITDQQRKDCSRHYSANCRFREILVENAYRITSGSQGNAENAERNRENTSW